jgi:FMN-dependent oxidoreductase (nitrilotriacetate monooxygenase family)
MTTKKDILLFWMPVWGGFHLAGWRGDDAPNNPPLNFAAIRDMVQTAERGKLHGCFLADSLLVGMQGTQVSTEALSRTTFGSRFEPITLLSALAGCTKHIGLLATASTTYTEPFHVARMFASLDHLSGGRSGWNVVTSKGGGEGNFGREQHMEHGSRYDRAQEFVEIVTGLWDSWEDDAFLCDKTTGIYFDPDKLHALNYQGEYLSVTGPLNIARPVQGHPVIAQAGSSADGREFAARNADVIYTLQATIEKGKTFYDEIKEQVAEHGRDPQDVKVLPGLIFAVGRSQAEAEEKIARLDEMLDPKVGIERLSALVHYDLSEAPLDEPVPDIPETTDGSQGGQKYFVDIARRDNLTVRQFMQVTARLGAIPGTATTIADMIQEWVEAGAADGLNINFADATDSMEVFVDEVVPELQRRGVFQNDYRGRTLRENLGLPRPANRFVGSSLQQT